MSDETKTTNFAGLAIVGVAVALLYAVVLAKIDSPLWRSLVRGEPVGIETRLTGDELAQAGLLHTALDRMGYGLDKVAKGGAVPRLFLPSVPGDLAELPETDTKKQVFLRVMLPLVLVVNEEIAENRRRLESIAKKGADESDRAWLEELAARYEAPDVKPQTLLKRVDVVPPSLALAQSAEESGWGTSRPVREDNNLFGHSGEDGIQPADGPRMAAFASLHEAVRAYVHNLNTHPAYEALRRARAAARARGAFPDGHSLAGTLTAYSERGHAYIDAIRAIIRANRLLRFDRAKLGDGGQGV